MNEFVNKDGDGWDMENSIVEDMVSICDSASDIKYILLNCTIKSSTIGKSPEEWLQNNIKFLRRELKRIEEML